jgi:hypothetical protein
VIGIGDDSPCRQFVVTDDIGHSLGIGMVADPQRPSHLLPEVFDLDLLEGSLDEFVYLGKDVLLPVFEEFILFDLGWLGGEEVLALDRWVGVEALLLDLVARIQFLQLKRDKEVLNLRVFFLIRKVIAEEV